MRENITKMKKIPDSEGFEPLPTSNHRLAVRSANHYTIETTVSVRHRKFVSSLQSMVLIEFI